ncbi:MAG: ribonuclease HI family protein [Candidatus Pacebacteria bacterium]|nr:ribonuclease HI family protein [Candidatus Paceibacterota bacterium]
MKVIVYTDGGARGNPGMAAIGVVFCNEKGECFKKYGQFLGDEMTNNEAEYNAVISALKKLKALLGKEKIKSAEVEVRSDSELLVNQMNGEYKLTDERIQQFFITVWNLKIDYKKVNFVYIPREKNKEADRLVNEALDQQSPPTLF